MGKESNGGFKYYFLFLYVYSNYWGEFKPYGGRGEKFGVDGGEGGRLGGLEWTGIRRKRIKKINFRPKCIRGWWRWFWGRFGMVVLGHIARHKDNVVPS